MRISLSPYFRSHKKESIIIFGLISILALSAVAQIVAEQNPISAQFTPTVAITVKVDGHIVYYAPHDLIMPAAFDYVICSAFNDTETNGACYNGAGNTNNGLLNFVGGTSNTAPNYLCAAYKRGGSGAIVNNVMLKNDFCSLTAVWLSTDTTAASTSSPFCYSALSANGFAPVQAVSSGHGGSSNVLTLTATWTASGTQTGIDKVCLSLWNFVAGKAVDTSSGTGSPYVLTIDTFTSQTVNVGQTFQVIYSISF